MLHLQRYVLALTMAASLTITASASAQIPDEFTNLKVLPEDIGKRDLIGIMKDFAGALGKRCNYCHVGEASGSLEGMDFASDEKETKLVARTMMKMTNDINTNHLASLERDDVIQVRCITCHHGVEEPETIDNVVLAVAETDGVDAAITRYREMRAEYYGAASYDFTAGPLNSVAETLSRQRNDIAGAISMMRVNIEFNPDESYSHLLLGTLHQASGDKASAIASVERSLELDPDNKWARKTLEQLKAAE